MNSDLQFSGCTLSSYEDKCFEVLSDEERKLLEENSVRINYKKGEVICKQGAFVSQILFVEKGLAKVFIDNGNNVLLLRIIPDGSFLGLSTISEDHSTFPYSAKTYVDSVIKQIDVNVFREIVRNNNDFAREIINILSAKSVQIYGRFFCLTFKQAYGRLADIILCLAERVFQQDSFELPLSRKDLAELAGMSAETVVRMLKKFNEDGLIEMHGKKLKVLDVNKLHRISQTG